MLALLGLAATSWLNQQARQAGRSDLGSDVSSAICGLLAVSAATVGAVLAGRRPRPPGGLAAADPDRTLPSRRWRWWARVAAVAPALGLVSLA